MLRDGRVGFIDFGIVGRISPVTWRAVEALLTATVSNDYITMARALATIGVTNEAVDIPVSRRLVVRRGLAVPRSRRFCLFVHSGQASVAGPHIIAGLRWVCRGGVAGRVGCSAQQAKLAAGPARERGTL